VIHLKKTPMMDLFQQETNQKFIRQKDDYSCAPTSLFNLCQFYNIPLTYSVLYKLCKCNKKSGTKSENFTFALHFILEKYCENKCEPCILVEYPIDDVTHFALLVDNYIINKDGKDKTKPIVQKMNQRFMRYLDKSADFWIIGKDCKVTTIQNK
jgi:hypothetical protein